MKLDAVKYGYKLAINDITDILNERIFKIYGTKAVRRSGMSWSVSLERVQRMMISKNTERCKHWEKLEDITNDDE